MMPSESAECSSSSCSPSTYPPRGNCQTPAVISHLAPPLPLNILKNQSVPSDLWRFKDHFYDPDGQKLCTCAFVRRHGFPIQQHPSSCRSSRTTAPYFLPLSTNWTGIRRVQSDRSCLHRVQRRPIQRECLIASSNQPLHTNYIVKEKIGQGSWGSVHIAIERESGLTRAVKKVSKRHAGELFRFRQEVKLVKSLDHPNIVRLYETFEDYANIYMIMEYCRGGELFDRLTAVKRFPEGTAASLIRQMLSATCYCHATSIAHRDLKPENFLFLSDDPNSSIKLIDFGLAKRFVSSKKQMRTKVGTLYFVSPQVLQGSYDEKCDTWSIGVMMYLLISGYPPFNGITDNAIINQIHNGEVDLTTSRWERVSVHARDLIRKLLSRNPATRPSAEEALQHQWFRVFAPHSLTSITFPPIANSSVFRSQSAAIFPVTSDDTFLVIPTSRRSSISACASTLNLSSSSEHSQQLLPQGSASKTRDRDTTPVPSPNQMSVDADGPSAGGKDSAVLDSDAWNSLDAVYTHWGNIASRLVSKWRRFSQHNQLKRAALSVVARQMNETEELSHIRALFMALDSAGSGTLSPAELASGLESLDNLSQWGKFAGQVRRQQQEQGSTDGAEASHQAKRHQSLDGTAGGADVRNLLKSTKLSGGLPRKPERGGTAAQQTSSETCGVCEFCGGVLSGGARVAYSSSCKVVAEEEKPQTGVTLSNLINVSSPINSSSQFETPFSESTKAESPKAESPKKEMPKKERPSEGFDSPNSTGKRSSSARGSSPIKAILPAGAFYSACESPTPYCCSVMPPYCDDDNDCNNSPSNYREYMAEAREVIEAVNLDCRGRVNYTEFLAACLDRSHYTRESVCRAAFRVFDRDGDGKIGRGELRAALGWDEQSTPFENSIEGETPRGMRQLHAEYVARCAEEKESTELQLSELITAADADGDGYIDFEEFMQVLTQDAWSTRYFHPFTVPVEGGVDTTAADEPVEDQESCESSSVAPTTSTAEARRKSVPVDVHSASDTAATVASAALTAELLTCLQRLLAGSVISMNGFEGFGSTPSARQNTSPLSCDSWLVGGYHQMKAPAPPSPQHKLDEETWNFFGV